MKTNLRLLFILMLSPLFGYSQATHLSEIKEDYMQFGSGGGFSGALNCFILTKNGLLYKQTKAIIEPDEIHYLKKISSCRTKNIFRFADKKAIRKIVYNEPSNRYYLLHLHSETDSTTLIWGDSSNETLLTTITLYKKLQKLTL